MSNFLLSICIPTKGRVDILKNTLNSIFEGYQGAFDDFEVVLSDNSDDDALPEMLRQYRDIPNIRYKRSGASGFLNSIAVLKAGTGMFLKLHNDYTKFKPGALSAMIDFVRAEVESKPLVFFTNAERSHHNIVRYDSFDSFAYDLSFLGTWSTGFAIWREDLEKYVDDPLNYIFPHTSLLLYQHDKRSFIIHDQPLFDNVEVKKKGGYNLFNAFAVQYPQMLKECMIAGGITQKTLSHIKDDLFYNFLVVWYYNTKIADNEYTYELNGIKESLSVNYSGFGYYCMVALAYKKAILKGIKKKLV